MSYYNKSRSGRLNYEVNDDGIEAIAPNLAKTISDMDRVLKEITTYEDDIEARTASLDDDDLSPCNSSSWDQNHVRDGAYYDGDDDGDYDDDDDGEERLTFAEKMADYYFYMSSCVGGCCERLVICVSSQPTKLWLGLAGIVLLGFVAGGGVAIANSLASSGASSSSSTSNESPSTRDERITLLLNAVSDPALFDDKNSLQWKAKDWLINSNVEASDKIYIQRYVLALFYSSLYGSSWTSNENWMSSDESECAWFGIKCQNDVVVELELNQNNLVGSIPNEVKHLQQLDIVLLNDNFLDGAVDNLFEMKKVRHLEVGNNQLNGSLPQSIGTMSKLGT